MTQSGILPTLRGLRRRSRHAAIARLRAIAWRVLGLPASPNLFDAASAAPRLPALHVVDTANPWSALRADGLRIEPGLEIRTKKSVEVRFEAPVQLNKGPLNLYRGIEIGRYSYLRTGTVRHVRSIGRYTSIAPGVILGESEHPTDWLTTSPAAFTVQQFGFYPPDRTPAAARVIPRTRKNSPASQRGLITIGNDVWIGANAMIRRGLTIGDGAIVAAGAFVNHDVAPYTIVAGLPAKPIRRRFDDDTVARLLALRWWEFDISDLAGVDFSHIHAAIEEIEQRERIGALHRVPLRFTTVTLSSRGFSAPTVPPNEDSNGTAA